MDDRFFWGTTTVAWSLWDGSKDNGAKVEIYRYRGATFQLFDTQVKTSPDPPRYAWRIWKLIPVERETEPARAQSPHETPGPGFPPAYHGDGTEQPSARTQTTESERDDFGTVVTEVTIVTTRKRYRVEEI